MVLNVNEKSYLINFRKKTTSKSYLKDCAFPLVNSLTATCDQTAAFTDIDVAVLVGAFPRKPGMERKVGSPFKI